MLRQGPLSAFLHGVIEYLAAALLIASPFLFGFDSGTAKAVAIVLGITILAVTASSDLPTGLAKTIPVTIHVVLDYIVAALMIAAPFLFRFTGDSTATAFFVTLGIAHLLITIATRFLGARVPATEASGR